MKLFATLFAVVALATILARAEDLSTLKGETFKKT